MMENGKQFVRRANELHRDLLVVDGHCDTILEIARGRRRLGKLCTEGHVDLVRMIEGGIKIQVFAAFVETAYKPYHCLSRVLQLIDTFYFEMDECRDIITPGLSIKQIRKDIKDGKIIAVLGIEGGEALNGELAVLRMLFRLGVRLIGLTWNQRNQIADGVGESITGGGLTEFGRQVIREMNKLGIIIDLAHISEAGFWDALEFSDKPVLVSHANCAALCGHPRNLSDSQIKALAKKGGVLGMSFVPEFLGGEKSGIDVLLDHIDHVAGLAGTDVIALGSDFDGIDKTAEGLRDCRCYPMITAKLIERGYTEKEIRNIMGKNLFRLMERVFVN